MSKSDVFENDFLKLIFNGTAITGLADNAATSPVTNLHFSLHTGDPSEGGSQLSNEVVYTGYGRVAVPRTTGGFTVTANSVSPAAPVTFGQSTAGGAIAFFFAVGTAASGSGKILYRGVLGSDLGPFTGAVTGNVLTIPGNTLAVDDRIIFRPVPNSILPAGVVEGTVYWVKTVSGDAVTVSLSQGGAALAITAAGDGVAFKAQGIAISPGVTPQLSAATAIVED